MSIEQFLHKSSRDWNYRIEDIPSSLLSFRTIISYRNVYYCEFIDDDGVIQKEYMCDPSEFDLFEKFEGKEIEKEKLAIKHIPLSELDRIVFK